MKPLGTAGGAREKAGGVLLALYVLVGRWDVSRLFSLPDKNPFDVSLLELRFWVVLGLVAVAFSLRGGRAALGAKSGVKTFAFSLNAFFIYFLLTALWSPDGRYAFVKTIEIILVLLSTMSVYKLTVGERGAAARTWFWAIIVGVTGVLGAIAIMKAVTLGPSRLAVLGGGPNVFGRMMGLLCLGSLYFWRRGGGLPFIAATVLSVVLVILSGSRGSIVAVAGGVAAFFLVERIKIERLAGFILGAALLGAAVFLYTPVGQKAVATYDHRINKLLIDEGYTSGRGDRYRVAYGLGIEKPVLGAGMAAFPALGYGGYCHNFFLEIFSEGGLVGLALVLAPFVFLAKRYWGIKDRLDGSTVAAAVFTFAAVQFSGDLFDSRALFAFMLMSFLPVEAKGGDAVRRQLPPG